MPSSLGHWCTSTLLQSATAWLQSANQLLKSASAWEQSEPTPAVSHCLGAECSLTLVGRLDILLEIPGRSVPQSLQNSNLPASVESSGHNVWLDSQDAADPPKQAQGDLQNVTEK